MGRRNDFFKDWDDAKVKAHNERIRRERAGAHSGTGASTNNESVHQNADETPRDAPEPLPQVVIRFTHYSRRTPDADSGIGKWFVDGIVEAGILPDDSPEFVKEYRHRHVKIETWEEERTMIELIEA